MVWQPGGRIYRTVPAIPSQASAERSKRAPRNPNTVAFALCRALGRQLRECSSTSSFATLSGTNGTTTLPLDGKTIRAGRTANFKHKMSPLS